MNLAGDRIRTDKPIVDPQWEHMNESDEDDEDWEHEEVSYLVLDAGQDLTAQQLASCREIQISLKGLNTPHPYVRIGSNVYETQHENLLGSELLLKEHPPTDSGNNEKPIPSHTPFALTSKRLRMQKVDLVPKNEAAEAVTTKGGPKKRTAKTTKAKNTSKSTTSKAPSPPADSDPLLG